MRWAAMLLVAAVVVSACGSGGDGVPPGTDTPELMGLALRQLVAEDNSFGPGHRFTELMVQEQLDPSAGGVFPATGPPGRLLTAAERAAIEEMLSPLGSVRWIGDPRDYRTDDLRPVVDGSAILGVGEPTFDEEGALVPVSLWCGGLCGIWLTYRLVSGDEGWILVGPEGSIAVS